MTHHDFTDDSRFSDRNAVKALVRGALILTGIAIAYLLIAAQEPQPPRLIVPSEAPIATIEDWHGNVRRSSPATE